MSQCGVVRVWPDGEATVCKSLLLASSSGALLMIPLAPNLPIMLLASFAVGFTSVTPQLAIPYVAGLVPGAGRGKVVGMVAGKNSFRFISSYLEGSTTPVLLPFFSEGGNFGLSEHKPVIAAARST
jgi:hypothetical protein